MLHIQTAVVNNPTFIELQYDTLRYFARGPYTFTVYNDAKDWPDYSNFNDPSIRRAIQRTCERLSIPCVSIDNTRHKTVASAATRCADAMTRMLEDQRTTNDRYLVLDSDMFPIAPFSVDKYSAYDAAFVEQRRTGKSGTPLCYAWNGIYYLDMGRLQQKERLDWSETTLDGYWTDVGGAMHPYIQDVKPNYYPIQHLPSLQWSLSEFPGTLDVEWLMYAHNDPRNVGGKYFAELYDNTFLHFRAGGNWEVRAADGYNANVERLRKAVYSVCRQ